MDSVKERRKWDLGGDNYLLYEFFIHGSVAIGAIESLLQECKQDRYDNSSLQRLSKDDEEDGNGEHVDGHFDSRLHKSWILSGDSEIENRSPWSAIEDGDLFEVGNEDDGSCSYTGGPLGLRVLV